MSSDLDIIQSVVIAIQGVPVNSTFPTDGYALIYDAADGYWRPTALPSSFVMGGDISGTTSSATVNSISGSSVIYTGASKINLLKGQNINVSSLKTSNYAVSVGDFIVGVGALTSSITITLPSSPSVGDMYVIKDVNGTCQQFCRDNVGTFTVVGYTITVLPSSGTIDGLSKIIMQTPYQSITVVYTGSQWSII